MSNQLFKEKVPNEILINLFKIIGTRYENYYIIDNNSYKKGVFNGYINIFLNECKDYYHNSKKKYVERKMNYNYFITIVRQICKFNEINFTSNIKYDKSNYELIYHIYI